MAGKIYVVYARAATGLKLWPIAIFCNSDTAAADARTYATEALAGEKCFRAGTGSHTVAKTEIREYGTWTQIPAFSRGF